MVDEVGEMFIELHKAIAEVQESNNLTDEDFGPIWTALAGMLTSLRKLIGQPPSSEAPPLSEDSGKKYGCFYCEFRGGKTAHCNVCVNDYDTGLGWTFWKFKDNPRKPLSKSQGGELSK